MKNYYDSKKEWTKAFLGNEMAFPSEYVIRIFRGQYPNLNLNKKSFQNKRICDVGCGDGRNLCLLKRCNFEGVFGVEITTDIVNKINFNIHWDGVFIFFLFLDKPFIVFSFRNKKKNSSETPNNIPIKNIIEKPNLVL